MSEELFSFLLGVFVGAVCLFCLVMLGNCPQEDADDPCFDRIYPSSEIPGYFVEPHDFCPHPAHVFSEDDKHPYFRCTCAVEDPQ